MSGDSVLTDPSHFLEIAMSRKTFSRFIVSLLSKISDNLREICQLIRETWLLQKETRQPTGPALG